jgi:hypothetical protein
MSGEDGLAQSPEAPEMPASVRPAVYGRNYSYFSHRIFVAFMPEDLHKYLHDRLSLVTVPAATTPQGGSAHIDSDAIDAQLVRWVLLHRSQLNALALNREIEAWRGNGDLLLLPSGGGLRSDPAYRLDITLQFAVELALAAELDSDLLKNRPRLLLALLDAAYFVSRRRAEQDRLQDAASDDHEADIDLSESGRAAFEAYLVQRMNLEEDKGPLPAPARRGATPPSPAELLAGAMRGPLSVKEVNWLHGVAIGVARTLSSNAGPSDLKERWQKGLAARWSARDLPAPDSSLFEALLTGPDSPLVALSAAGDDTSPGAAPRAIESFRYRWRCSQFDGAPWAQSLIGIARHGEAACTFIEHVDVMLRHALVGPDAAGRSALDPEAQGLRLLSDRYRVLPTTPAWAAVSDAISRMRLARKGVGNTGVLIRDGQLLYQYADMLRTGEAADAVSFMLLAGAALAGFQAGSRQLSPPTVARSRPQPADWTVALSALHDGLRLDGIDVVTAAARLRETYVDLVGIYPSLPAPFRPRAPGMPPPDGVAWTHDGLLAAWPTLEELDAAVVNAFEGARAFSRLPPEDGLVARGWPHLQSRLLALAYGQDGVLPAHASELVCTLQGMGPWRLLPLRLAGAGARMWTEVLLDTLQERRRDNDSGGASSWSAGLVAHALERLGARALRADSQQDVLHGLTLSEQARREISEYVSQHTLWSGDGLSRKLALVLGPWQESMAEEWPLPPNGGLILAATEANLQRLLAAGLEEVIRLAPEPLRVAFEPWTTRPGELDQLEAWVKGLPKQQVFIRLWLYREGRVGLKSPQLVDPDSPDELWNWGPALEPTS